MIHGLPTIHALSPLFHCLRLFATVGFIALSGLVLVAQERATLRLLVEDEVGGVLVAVRVSVANAKGGTPKELATTREGVAVFTGLEPGEYHVTIAAPGFKTVER